MSNQSIKALVIDRLHDQIDIEIEFNAGLNIIYGKNGRGKTTILHVIANALEQDFFRFSYLRFSKIRLDMHSGDYIEIEHGPESDDGESIQVSINGNKATPIMKNNKPTDVERQEISKVLGQKPVYLPAFRAILEKFDQSDARWRGIDGSPEKEAYMAVFAPEFKELVAQSAFESRYQQQRQAEAIAYKTVQCREWFGSSVPVVRYPSISEVQSRLSNEWRQAQLEVARSEEEMFSEIFAQVFEAVVSGRSDEKLDFQSLLDEFSNTIPELSSSERASRDVFARITKSPFENVRGG